MYSLGFALDDAMTSRENENRNAEILSKRFFMQIFGICVRLIFDVIEKILNVFYRLISERLLSQTHELVFTEAFKEVLLKWGFREKKRLIGHLEVPKNPAFPSMLFKRN
jgi:hypothetical protein